MVTVINIGKESVKYIGKNWVGNKYLNKWVVYIRDNRKSEYGDQMLFKGKYVASKIGFIGNKKEVKGWLTRNKVKFDF